MKTYKPGFVADADMRRELTAIEQAAQRADPHILLQKRHAAPDRLFEGMVIYADGTDYEPVALGGEGFYGYTSAGWVKLG